MAIVSAIPVVGKEIGPMDYCHLHNSLYSGEATNCSRSWEALECLSFIKLENVCV